jgi:hypothetical protein
MNKLLAVLCFGLAGCNFDVGDCYLRSEGESGAGGIIITATGVGGYGFGTTGSGGFGPVLEPQGIEPPPPECNIATQSPCNEKCQADHDAASVACGKSESEAQRSACSDSAYANYRSCRESCQRAENKDCDDKYQDCVDNGPTSCRRKSAGKTVCQRCWERCNAGDSPSDVCRGCKF